MDIGSLIRRRRGQMLVHSYLYYWLGDSILSDHQWQEWADELTALQAEHGTEWGYYDKEFADWTGATGCHLPKDAHVIQKTRIVMRYHAKCGP